VYRTVYRFGVNVTSHACPEAAGSPDRLDGAVQSCIDPLLYVETGYTRRLPEIAGGAPKTVGEACCCASMAYMMGTKFLGLQVIRSGMSCRLVTPLTPIQRSYLAALGLSAQSILMPPWL